jgi:uncharacterized protein (UPF0264 family)
MTRLLVSVRDTDEAQIAVQAGADLIDVKEPRRGSLGAADAEIVAAIVDVVADRMPVSMALGELLERSLVPVIPHGVRYAKVGLAGCGDISDWPARWERTLEGLPIGTRPVAVVYADTGSTSPSRHLVMQQASRLGCAAVLVDTWNKMDGPLTAHWSQERICSFVLDVQNRGMLAVIGGGLTAELIEQILPARPDFVAVRGAVCQEGRTGSIDVARIRRLAKLLDQAREKGSGLALA